MAGLFLAVLKIHGFDWLSLSFLPPIFADIAQINWNIRSWKRQVIWSIPLYKLLEVRIKFQKFQYLCDWHSDYTAEVTSTPKLAVMSFHLVVPMIPVSGTIVDFCPIFKCIHTSCVFLHIRLLVSSTLVSFIHVAVVVYGLVVWFSVAGSSGFLLLDLLESPPMRMLIRVFW